MNSLKKCFFVFAGFLFFAAILGSSIYLARFSLLRWAGHHLVYTTDLKPSDAIVVLGGDPTEKRLERAVSLYKQGLAPLFVIAAGVRAGDRSYAQWMKRRAMVLGVPVRAILVDTRSESTYENAQESLALLKGRSVRRVILVTSDFHTRRSYNVFQTVFKDSGIELLVAGSDDGIDYDEWWRHESMAEDVVIEWVKTGIYWWRGRI